MPQDILFYLENSLNVLSLMLPMTNMISNHLKKTISSSFIFMLLLAPFGARGSSTPVSSMNLKQLQSEAFALCQAQHSPPVITPVPMLDPPTTGNPWDEGLVYQEELSILTAPVLDQYDFYFLAKPRAALNTLEMDIFLSADRGETFERISWDKANPDYSAKSIQPAINKEDIPAAGRVLTELILGHRAPDGGYPQLFNIRSSAYVRFSGYTQIQGASLRLAAHRIFGTALHENSAGEDFPIVRKVYGYAQDTQRSKVLALVENGLFCGALEMEMEVGDEAHITVDGYWYTREDFRWKQSPHTALVAYSSMLWKTEKHTPKIITDEAHDSDVLNIYYNNNVSERHELHPPEQGVRVTHFSDGEIKGWSLNNEDRNPLHYQDFAPALGATNYNLRASYGVEILASSVKTAVSSYEEATSYEYADNIVAASTLREDFPKSRSVKNYIHFKYKTTSHYPPSPYVVPR